MLMQLLAFAAALGGADFHLLLHLQLLLMHEYSQFNLTKLDFNEFHNEPSKKLYSNIFPSHPGALAPPTPAAGDPPLDQEFTTDCGGSYTHFSFISLSMMDSVIITQAVIHTAHLGVGVGGSSPVVEAAHLWWRQLTCGGGGPPHGLPGLHQSN